MANPSLQIGNSNWAIKESNLLGYSTAGTKFLPQPITMTRASAGTRVNPQGLVETVELLGSELLTNGDFATNSDWTLGTNTSISGGKLINSNSTSYSSTSQALNMSAGTYLFTFTIDSISNGGIFISFTGFNGTTRYSAGTYSQYVTLSNASSNIFIAPPSSGTSYTISNISVKESTKNNLARVDYDGTASSLLVEPQRTNVLPYSENFSQWSITSSGTTLSVSTVNSPSGEQNAYKLEASGGNLFARIDYVVSITSGNNVFYSVFVKKSGTNNIVTIRLQGTNIGGSTISSTYEFNFSTETMSRRTGGNATSTLVQNVGNGWYRVGIEVSNSTITNALIYPAFNDANGGEVLIWGAQLVESTYPTSYIPTSGSSVTRVADQYSKTGISNLINSTEGVLFVEMAALADDLTNRVISISDGTISNRVIIFYTNVNNAFQCKVTSSGTDVMNKFFTVTNITSFNKIAVKWKANDFAIFSNGVEVFSDSSGAAPSSLNQLKFDRGDGAEDFFGKVKQLQVFKTALTDSELIALTT